MKTFLLISVLCICKVSSFRNLKCGNRVYSMISPSQWTCCGSKLYPKNANYFACCDKKCYNPSSQYCCGNKIYTRLNINSACCNGKAYQRGYHGCCNKILINLKTHDCCRTRPYNMETHICCNGVVTKYERETNKTQCCGNFLYNPSTEMCCAGNVTPKFAGQYTKCCMKESYDSRTSSCCMGKIIEREKDKDECCHGIMIYSAKQICCGNTSQPRVNGHQTGCCRIGGKQTKELPENADERMIDKLLGGSHVTYDKLKSICCSGKLLPRQYGSNAACCKQDVYDVKSQICCIDKIHNRSIDKFERCCNNQPFDRSHHICCHGNLFKIAKTNLPYMFCCGSKVYDRRKAQCHDNKTISMYQCSDPVYLYGTEGRIIPRKHY